MVLALLKSESIICLFKNFVKTGMKWRDKQVLALAGNQGYAETIGTRSSPWHHSLLMGS
jgi:hypothetical protein